MMFRIKFVLTWLSLVAGAVTAGPVMTDSNLFAALNLNYPGLDLVRTNVAQTNYTAAKTNLATYLRARTNVTWFFDPHAITNAVPFSQSAADQTTNAYINSIGIGYTFTNGVINWYYNVTKDTNYPYADNNEWQWQINRMSFWPNLGSTWWGNGNDVYTKHWVNQLQSWLTACPVPASVQNGSGSCWRTIESGIRMNSNWPNTYHRFLLSPSFTDQDVCDYLKSCIEHSRYLAKFYTAGNWLTMEMSGLYTVGALYPEVKDAATWRAFAGQKLYSEETNQFFADGVQKELSPGYHGVALGNILTIYNVAALEGLVPELPTNYVANLENGYAHYLRMMTPDRMMPQFNDTISAPNAQGSLATAAALFTNRLDFLWVASNGASGAPPSFVSCNYPWAGYNVMRSGWSRSDNYLCLDGGVLGAAHIHQDKLNVVAWAYGRRILFDSGGGNYETSIWRSYGISAYSHNTVIVDGQNQAGGDGSVSYSDPDYVAQAPINSRWETDANRDFAAGIYNLGYGSYTSRPAAHTRRILFVKPDLYLVADTLAPTNTASHTYEARWHLLPTNTVADASTKSVTTADAGVPNLAVVPCLLSNLTVASVVARSNSTYSLLLGWNITGSQSGPSPATTVTHTRTGAGTNQFLTLLMPLPTGAANPVTNVVATGASSSRLELSDGRKLLVSADPNPARGLRLVELLADGTTNRLAGGGFTPPSISAIADQVTAPNTPVGPLAFTIGEMSLSPTNLTVFAQSFDPRLVANSGLVLSGSGSNRTVTVTPAPGRAGDATIRLTVMDTNGATASTDFNVRVVMPAPATYFWDTATNAGLQPASGIWSGAVANWSATNAGSNPLLPWPALGNDAVFTGVGGTYTITVSATQNVNHLTFTNGIFTVSGGVLNHFVGPLNVTAHSNAALNSPLVADTDLVKLGPGTLTLGGPASFTGDTLVSLGTLKLAASDILPATSGLTLGERSNAGTLDLSASSQSFNGLSVISTNSTTTNLVTVSSGQAIKFTGPVTVGLDNGGVSTSRIRMSGGGALVVTNAAENFTVGYSVVIANTTTNGNSASLDCSKLGSVTLGTASAPLGELRVGYGNGSGSTTHTLTLSETNNSITATTVQVGNSVGANGSSGTLLLGSGTNVIATDTLNIGLAKVAGTVKFAAQTAGSPGTVTIRGKTGPATALWIGYKNGTGTAANPTSTLDLRGHHATVTASRLSIAVENGSSSGGEIGSLYFDTGTFTVTNVILAAKSGTSTSPAVGTLNVSGGTFTVCAGGSFTLAYQTNTSTASGTLNLTGGTFNSQVDILDGGGTNTSTITLNGGALNLFGHTLGSTTNINTLNFQSGTLQNVGEINAGATPLVKTGSGALTLGGTNGFTGGTVVMAGTLQLAGNLASSLTVSNGLLTGSGVIAGNLRLATSATLQPRLNGYLPGNTYDQLAVTGTVTLAGALSLSVTNTSALPTGYAFTIIRNDGALPVSGTFAGLPQLATFTNGALAWRVNYQGGDGNDVTLTLLSGGAVIPPNVTLTAPTNNATVGVPLTFTAAAASPWGVATVAFYADALFLSSDSSAPYALTLDRVVPGPHTFTAVARDNSGLTTTSAPVTVTVVSSAPAAPHLLGLALANGQPRLQIDGPAKYIYLVDVSTNLTIWTNVLATNSPALPLVWTDADSGTFRQRFYRVRLAP
jgi:autotransporter-associated beta strand protein